MVCIGGSINWFCERIGEMSTEEIMEVSTEIAETETLVEVDSSAELEILTQISNDVRVIMAFVVITFVMSCMRGWRRNVVKGVH